MTLPLAFISIVLSLGPAEPAELPADAEPAKDPPDVDATPAVEASPAADPEPAASEWSDFMNRTVDVVWDGKKIRGKFKSHTDETVAIVESNGVVSDIPKSSITELTIVPPERKEREPFDDGPRRRSRATRAEPAENEAAGGFRRRGKFLLFSPGLVGVGLKAPHPISYRWGFSVGGMIPGENSRFAGAYGFTFEHFAGRSVTTVPVPMGLDVVDEKLTTWTNIVRALAELRIGGSGENVFGYMLFGAGFTIFRASTTGGPADVRGGAGGFAFPVGAGIQGLVGQRFVVGFEPRFVFDALVNSGVVASFDARFVLGAKW